MTDTSHTAPGSLERAICIAAQAHQGQVDKAGEPYILHPLRVMLACSTPEARIVAVLHDVVEDSDWTLEGLGAAGFGPRIRAGIEAVTRRPDEEPREGETEPEAYLRFCRRAAAHPLGREVKRADLLDNLDSSRLGPEPTERDRARMEKYRRALEVVG